MHYPEEELRLECVHSLLSFARKTRCLQHCIWHKTRSCKLHQQVHLQQACPEGSLCYLQSRIRFESLVEQHLVDSWFSSQYQSCLSSLYLHIPFVCVGCYVSVALDCNWRRNRNNNLLRLDNDCHSNRVIHFRALVDQRQRREYISPCTSLHFSGKKHQSESFQ